MNDTYFYLPEEKLARFAVLYKPGPDNRIEIDEKPDRNSLYFRERTFLSGTGGLVSTVSDYLRFQQMMLNGGELDGVRILGRKTVELISSQPYRQSAGLESRSRLRLRTGGFGRYRRRSLGTARLGWNVRVGTARPARPRSSILPRRSSAS